MRIKIANELDLSHIVAIYNEAIPDRQATADTEFVSIESRLEWFRNHNDRRPLWIAEKNQEIMGWVSLQDFYGRPAYQKTVEFSIYVKSVFRRQGVAQTLLSYAINECSRLGISTLLGFIFAHNQPSIRLVKKYGFEQRGYLPKIAQLDAMEKDLIIFGRRISNILS